MPTPIAQAKILILSDNGFEQSELMVPRDSLREHGAAVHVATPDGGAVRGWSGEDWGESAEADLKLGDADAADYDALVLPGGQINPDLLRVNPEAISLIQAFHAAGKPIAAVCHAPWLLIEAGLAKGLRATSYGSIKTDMINAGANWVDQSAVSDRGIITSRNPDDLDDFVDAIVAAVEKGVAAEAA
jgi:protease I